MGANVGEIVRAWNEGEESRFAFACLCAEYVGKRDGATQQIADKIRRSVDVVENYARAGRLWMVLIRDNPHKAEEMREDLPISFWLPLARLYESEILRIPQVWEWMETCVIEKWTVEKFRSLLPNPNPKDLNVDKYIKDLEKLVNRPQPGANNRTWEIVNRLLRKAIELLKKSGGASSGNGEDLC